MRKSDVVLLILAAALAPGQSAAAQSPFGEPLALDQLLEVSSVVGRETPRWSPEGDRILFESALGGFMTIAAEGGFPVRVPVEPGGAEFLGYQEPRWSPDGTWISYVSDKSGQLELWLYSLQTADEIQLTALGGRINSYSWSPDGRSIALSGDRYGNYDIWLVSVPDGAVRRLTADARYEVFPAWTADSGSILYVRLDDRWLDHEVLEMPAQGGQPHLVLKDENFFDYGAGRKFGYPRLSSDQTRLLFPSQRSGWINYWVAAQDGGEPRPVAPEPADQDHARWSPDGRWIAYTSNHNGTYDLRVVAADGGEPRVLVAPEGMGVVASPEWSPDGRRISYTLETPTRAKDLYVVSVESGEVRRLTRSMPEGGLEARLVKPRKIAYRSGDFTIHAYLYAPPGAEAAGRKYPGVLWIHGGPTSQFRDTFQQHVQFFVQRGYVVLLPNIRGSSGYGRAFEDANNGCWGRCDLEDVRAGAEYLKALPYVDAGSIGITGTSYGGCMSMAAVGFAPRLFQAAIPLSGYADWFHFYEEQELRHIKLLDFELGTPDENPETYRRSSPMFVVEDVTTPVFLAHGEGLFPRSEASRNFAAALEKHYKVFQYKTYPNENYYIYRRDNRRELLKNMLEFFDRFLKGRNGRT